MMGRLEMRNTNKWKEGRTGNYKVAGHYYYKHLLFDVQISFFSWCLKLMLFMTI